jgi:hypothetical protein
MVMLRLLFGMVAAIGILYAGLHIVGRRAHMNDGAAQPGAVGPPQARKVISDVDRFNAQNRAALDRTVQTADESH